MSPADPFALFARWYADAEGCSKIRYPAALCLSTVDPDGLPEGRIVLLEQWDRSGFVFFTDRESAKGRALAARPEAALTFYWGPLERQIRIAGDVVQDTDAVADACFATRPRKSQITAWASRQSRPLASRAALDERYRELETRFADCETVPRPPNWRAYRLRPRSLEFWAAGACRLHRRDLYLRRPDNGWEHRLLEP